MLSRKAEVFLLCQNLYAYILRSLRYSYIITHLRSVSHRTLTPYFELSLGTQSLQAHDTLHYPSQQVLWWFAHLLPTHNLFFFFLCLYQP